MKKILLSYLILSSVLVFADVREEICLELNLRSSCLQELAVEENEILDGNEHVPNRVSRPLPSFNFDGPNILSKSYHLEQLYFMQSAVSTYFRDGKSVLATALDLKDQIVGVHTLPRLKVWMEKDAERIWSLDHRRLVAMQLARSEYALVEAASFNKVQNDAFKFTTVAQGEWIYLKLPFNKLLKVYRSHP